MTRSRVCIWMLIALLSPAAFAEEDFISSASLHDAGLVKFWQLQLPLEKGQHLRDAYLVDDQLYFGTGDGYVFAVDAYTGVVRWLQPVTRSGYRIRRPCHVEQQTIFVTPIDIQVYDRRSGDGIARREIRFPSATGPVSDNKHIFIGGLDDRLYAFDARTLMVDWRVIGDGPITSTPVVRDEYVFFASEGGTAYACTRDKKVLHWPNPAFTSGAIVADIVVDDNGVYVASRDQSLYLFDTGFGQLHWRVRFASALLEAPYVATEFAYQYAAAEGLVAVETTLAQPVEERVRWKLPQGRQALAVNEDFVYVRSLDDNLLVVRQKDGTVEHTVPVGGFTLGIPVQDSPTIFLASSDGRLFCARPRGAPVLRYKDVLDALRPPGAQAATTMPATTQPAASQPAAGGADELRSKRGGLPIGGKSKISREFRRKEETE